MRVLQFAAQNIQRVECLDITPDEFIVEIAGKNRQGKTTAIHCLSMAIEGAKAIHKEPIRTGAEEGVITLTLGSKGRDGAPDKVDMVVRREFSRREGTKSDPKPFATKLTLTLADGQQPRKAQEILNGLYNTVCTDPLSFTKLSAKDQFDKLRAMVPGFDFEAHDNKQRADFNRRTDVNRDLERAKAAAAIISVPADTPDELVDEKAITDAMANAGSHNSEIERRMAARENAAQKVETLTASAKSHREQAAKERQDVQEEINRIMAEAKARAERAQAKAEEIASQHEADAEGDENEASTLQKRLNEAEPLPDPVDTATLQAQLAAAQATNAKVREKQRKAEQLANAAALEAEAAELTARLQAREDAKKKAITEAKLPVDGLSFGDGEILLNGLPFEQASFREQLVTSCAIALANKPDIRILHVADGNALDEEGWAILRDLAEKNDAQIWVESVRPETETAIILENGKVKE